MIPGITASTITVAAPPPPPPDPPEPFFASDPILTPGWESVSGPSAFYVAALDKTFVSWQFANPLTGDKGIHVAAYDHATSTWSKRYTIGNFFLTSDDHGHPAIVMDNDGYIHSSFGAHANGAKSASTVAANDISAWTQNPVGGTNVSYPKLNNVSGAIYWMFRDDTDLNRRKLAVRSGTPAAGILTYGAAVTLVDFGADSRVYQGEAHAVGADIHFVCTKANAADTARTGVYYFVYKTATGAVENFDGSVSTASGSLPISLATADASYRIFAPSGSDDGNFPSLQFSSGGLAHVIFGNGTEGGGYDLMHMVLSAGSWSAPTAIGTLDDNAAGAGYVDSYSMVPGASGKMEAWFTNSGDAMRAQYSGSAWATPEVILAAGSHNFGRYIPVKSATPALRTFFGEILGNVIDANAVPLNFYAYGDSGPVNDVLDMTAEDANWASVRLLLGAESRDASLSLIDESPMTIGPTTFNGNAQIDTAQKKFGNASLLLDGTGDYISYNHRSVLSVSQGDHTIEAWIRISATGRIHTIVAKRPASGGVGEFDFIVNATNVLQFLAWTAAAVLVVNITGTTALTTGVWYHVAMSRSGTTWRIFLDGIQEATAVESAAPGANAEPMMIGRDQSNTARDFQGWIDEFRFTAVARYTANFTAPAAAFPRK